MAMALILAAAQRNTRRITVRRIWTSCKQFSLMRNAADTFQARTVTSHNTPTHSLEDAQVYFNAMKSDGRAPGLIDCLQVTSMILEAPDPGDGRKRLLMDDVVTSMALSDGTALLGKQRPAFYAQVRDLGEFYEGTGDSAAVPTVVKMLAPLAAQCVTSLLKTERLLLIIELNAMLTFIDTLHLHQSEPVSQAMILAKSKLMEIVSAVDDSNCFFVPPMMGMIVVVARSHAYDTRLRGWDLVGVAMARITPLMSSDNLLRLPRVISGREMEAMCSALPLIGNRDAAFMDAVAHALCDVVPVFPPALLNWFNWSTSVMLAYGHLRAPAPRLAAVTVDFIERGAHTPFPVRHTGVKILRLCWALVVQAQRPPQRLVDQLTRVVQSYLLGDIDLNWDVHKLPHVLFLLPEPWPSDPLLATQVARDTLARSGALLGERIKAAAPDALVNLVFPHAGLVTALGLFDATTCDLVPYPPQLPCPTELPPGALKALAGGCVGVAFLDVGMHDYLYPAKLLAGTIHRRKWLLERMGWCVCACDSRRHAGADIIEMMQLKARLGVLELLATLD